MAYTGFKTPTNKIVFGGAPIVQELKVESATNMYPGRLVQKGTNDDDIVVFTATTKMPVGWLGYEQTNPQYRPANVDTAYAADDYAAVVSGPMLIAGRLAKGCSVNKGDLLAGWSDGQVVGPAVPSAGGIAIGIPFGASDNTETDTYIDLPTDVVVRDAWIDVTTADSTETLNVGLLSSESGGDADGFLSGVSVGTAKKVFGEVTVTSGSNEDYFSACTYGALLADFTAGSDTATDVGTYARKYHRCDGTAKSVTYTGSAGSDTAAGMIWLDLVGEGLVIVGAAEESKDATSAAKDIQIRSML